MDSKESSIKQRRIAFDVIRSSSIFMVVFSHVFASIVWNPKGATPLVWDIMNILNGLTHTSVPLFLMLSGALLLNPQKVESVRSLFGRRMMNILIPLIVWSFIYAGHQALETKSHFSFLDTSIAIFNGPVQMHLWFLYTLLGLYATLPFMRIFVRHASKHDLEIFILSWLALQVILFILPNTLQVTFIYWTEGFTRYIGYFVLGYYLTLQTVTHKLRRVLLFLVFFLLSLSAVLTKSLVQRKGLLMDEFYYEFLSPNMIGLSVCLFMLLLSFSYETIFAQFPWMKKLMSLICLNSFGLYLMHMLVMQQLSWKRFGLCLTEQTVHPFIGVPLTTLAVMGLGISLTAFLKRIPILKYIV